MLLYCGCLNNLVEIPPVHALADLPEFLWPLLAASGHKGMHEVELILEPTPLSEYIPLPDLLPMPPDLPPPEPIVIEVSIIDISSSNSLTPAAVHC